MLIRPIMEGRATITPTKVTHLDWLEPTPLIAEKFPASFTIFSTPVVGCVGTRPAAQLSKASRPNGNTSDLQPSRSCSPKSSLPE